MCTHILTQIQGPYISKNRENTYNRSYRQRRPRSLLDFICWKRRSNFEYWVLRPPGGFCADPFSIYSILWNYAFVRTYIGPHSHTSAQRINHFHLGLVCKHKHTDRPYWVIFKMVESHTISIDLKRLIIYVYIVYVFHIYIYRTRLFDSSRCVKRLILWHGGI